MIESPCSACGDGDAEAREELDGRRLCEGCYQELAFGNLPRVTDTPAGVAGKMDDDFSFDRAVRAIEDGR